MKCNRNKFIGKFISYHYRIQTSGAVKHLVSCLMLHQISIKSQVIKLELTLYKLGRFFKACFLSNTLKRSQFN